MPFDPFGDFDTRGYLRNSRSYKTTSAVKRFEHREYYRNIHLVRDYLAAASIIDYAALLETHRLLFSTVYPWAGDDRATLGIPTVIVKGRLHFATAAEIHRIASQGLTLASDPSIMAKQPGLLIGNLAFAHPFLEGNGRAFLAVQTELARRAGISIDWRRIPFRQYLSELTREIVLPGEGHLDIFLAPYTKPNPDQLILEQHQPDFSQPQSTTRKLAMSDPVLRGPLLDLTAARP